MTVGSPAEDTLSKSRSSNARLKRGSNEPDMYICVFTDNAPRSCSAAKDFFEIHVTTGSAFLCQLYYNQILFFSSGSAFFAPGLLLTIEFRTKVV